MAKIQRLKKFHREKFWSIFKGFDREIIYFGEQRDFPPRDFAKRLQIDIEGKN